MQEGDRFHFSPARVVISLLLLTTVESSYVSSSGLANTIMFDPIMEETTIAVLFTITPTSSISDNLAREMMNNAVAVTFSETSTNKFEDIREDFLAAIATAITAQCASIDCGTQNHITYTSDHVGILPGYPRQEGSDVVVAFSVVLPQEAVPSHGGEVLQQDTLLSLVTAAVSDIRTQTGLDVEGVKVYRTPTTSSEDDNTTIVLILVPTLIPVGVIVVVATVGCLLMWKKTQNYHRSYYFGEVNKPGVEMVSYVNTGNEQ